MSKITSAFLFRVLGGALATIGLSSMAVAAGHGGGFHSGGGFHGGGGGGHVAFGGGGGAHGFAGGHAGFGGSAHSFAPAHYGAAHYSRGFASNGYVGGYSRRGGWGGGYWHGGYWPRAYYGPGFSWFLPVLPLGYATLWWGGSPFYYWDDAYYQWSPRYRGYVATEPPPVAATASDDGGDTASAGGAPDLYVYPRNGQNEKQTATDRFECHEWAAGPSGFDPSRSSNPAGATGSGYQRAITACLDARGYSAR